LDVARGRFIAFLDDDMDALEGWLEELVRVSLKYKAAITFGPAIAMMPNKDDPLNPFMEPFFARIADAPEGYITKCLGTGGCLLDLSLCNMPSPAFNPIHNETGGEDDALFHHLQNHGAKVAWASNLWCSRPWASRNIFIIKTAQPRHSGRFFGGVVSSRNSTALTQR